MAQHYVFHISDSYTPATIPMERLAQYLSGLARLLGESASVHFEDVFEGSTALRAAVDHAAQPKVRDRMAGLRRGDAPADALKAFKQLDDMLRKDNAFGALSTDEGANGLVIEFPGKRRPEALAYGPIKQTGTLDGQVYRIEGKDDTKHVGIRDGSLEFALVTDEAVALRLRHHLFGGALRFSGTGTWYRSADGSWELRIFKVKDFEVLEENSLKEVVDKLRAHPSALRDLPDPVAKLLEDRKGSEH